MIGSAFHSLWVLVAAIGWWWFLVAAFGCAYLGVQASRERAL